eukprot:scaffold97515_cov63-Phaeocystis_antarctica.AAC.3
MLRAASKAPLRYGSRITSAACACGRQWGVRARRRRRVVPVAPVVRPVLASHLHALLGGAYPDELNAEVAAECKVSALTASGSHLSVATA